LNARILHTDVQDYIRSHDESDLYGILLHESPFSGIDVKELAEQIASREKARKKLPNWFGTTGIYYPNKRNLEQSSSEPTADYKAKLVRANRVTDLTGGFGVDAYYFSKYASEVVYWETDAELAAMAAYNFRQMRATHIRCHCGDGLAHLNPDTGKTDLLYLDPSRRDKARNRVFLLSDCIPDVPGNLTVLLDSANYILLKTAPLLDLSAGLRELNHVREIHVVALQNEVKEVLWLLESGYEGEVSVTACNLKSGNLPELFTFLLAAEKRQAVSYSEPLVYLYEPNASIMKSGGFKSLGQQYGLPKLHEHSHLYTSEKLVSFPGRTFHIKNIVPYSRKMIKERRIGKANVSTRNFPESVTAIRKKFKIADGGSVYLFFTTSRRKGLIMIECEKN